MLFSARAVSALGDGISLVALTFAILSTGTASDLALVLLAREIPTVTVLLLGGVWADRLPRRLLLIGANLIMFVAQAGTAGLILGGSASIGVLMGLQAVYGLGNALFLPASMSVVPQSVSPGRLQQANALLALSRNSFGIVGPMVGALLVATVGPGWGLAADATTFLLAAIAVTLMRIAEPERTPGGTVFEDLRGGWREFTARTWVWMIVSSFGIYQLAVFPAFMVLGSLIAKNDLGGAGAWGTILAASSAGSVLGALAATRIKARRPLVLGQFLILPVVVLFVMFGLGAPLVVLVVAAVLAWACSEIGDTLWYTALQQHVPEEALGRISSFDYFGSQVFKPIGYAIVGPVAVALGAHTVMFGSATLLLFVTVAILLVPSVWQIRQVEPARQLDPEPEPAQ